MAIEADAALKAADAADAALAKGKSRVRCMACRWRTRTCITTRARSSLAARKSARISSPPTTSTALQRLKDAGTVRLGSLQMVEFAYGPTGHNPHYGAGAQSLGHRSHHRRLVVGIGLRGRGAPDLRGTGLRHRRLDPDARAFLRGHGLEDHGRPHQPRRRDAAVAVARYRRPVGAKRGGLRAAARADGGRRPGGSDRDPVCRCRITWPRRGSRSRA